MLLFRFLPAFRFTSPDEKSGSCPLQSGLGGTAGITIIGWVSNQQTLIFSFFLQKPMFNKPGSSGSLRFFIGAIANNGTAVSQVLLNARFQIKTKIQYLLASSKQLFRLNLYLIFSTNTIFYTWPMLPNNNNRHKLKVHLFRCLMGKRLCCASTKSHRFRLI